MIYELTQKYCNIRVIHSEVIFLFLYKDHNVSKEYSAAVFKLPVTFLFKVQSLIPDMSLCPVHCNVQDHFMLV